MMRAIRVLSLSLAAVLVPVFGAAADDWAVDGFKVVANDGVPVTSLSRSELARLFLKKDVEWSNGESVVPVDQSSISLVRAAFTEAVHDKKMSAITNYWQKQIFSGRGVPPPIRGTDLEVLEFVRSTPGAIGYVAAETSAPGVKTIAIE